MASELKFLFGHDHTFYYDDDGKVYSGGGLPGIVWNRYLTACGSLTVIGRDGGLVREGEKAKLALSSHQCVNFSLVKNISTLKAKIWGNRTVRYQVRKLVESHDAVIARLSSEIGLLLVKEARRQKKPYAIELVDCPFDALWNFGGIKAKMYAPFLALQVKQALKNTLFSLYVTERFLQKRYPSSKARTVSCSNVQIKVSENFSSEEKIKAIDKMSLPLRLGLIGSLNGNLKGIDTAIDAVAILDAQGVEIDLYVLGAGDSGRYSEKAKKLGISRRIHFDGVLPAGEPVLNWLDHIDIYIHPSLKEGLPRAVIEAMSRGCPVVATDVAGTSELIDSNFLISKKSPRKLAKKVNDLICSPELRKSQSLKNIIRSKDYLEPVLSRKRNDFWLDFERFVRTAD